MKDQTDQEREAAAALQAKFEKSDAEEAERLKQFEGHPQD